MRGYLCGAVGLARSGRLRVGVRQVQAPLRVFAHSYDANLIGSAGLVPGDALGRTGWPTFLRGFTFSHVLQLGAVASRVLTGLALRLLTGMEAMAFIDIDDTMRRVNNYSKQSVGSGYCGVKGFKAQVAARSSPSWGQGRSG